MQQPLIARASSKVVVAIVFCSWAPTARAQASHGSDAQCAAGESDRNADGNQLLQRSHLKSHAVLSATCAPLQLAGLDVGDCAGLSPGESCQVACPAGQTGGAARYFCFQSLADAGLPPASLQAPLCFPANSSVFQQDMEIPLRWVAKTGCLSCPNAWSQCSVVEDATDPSDARCTVFTLDLSAKLLRLGKWNMCIDMFSGPKPGLWGCTSSGNVNVNQNFELAASETWPGAHELCIQSGRGRMCLAPVGLPATFFETPPDMAVLQPALDALQAGDNATFLQQALAVQACRARLESGLPDDFWAWLEDRPREVHRALFATFPVHPGQVRLFSELVESFGRDKVEELGLASLIMAVSWVNRGKTIDEAVRFPHPGFEQNGNTFLAGEEDRIRQEMVEEGKHCGLQSNECNNLNKDCCAGGAGPDSWKFKWPRDPSPSVREWAHWLVDQAVEHPDKMWADPREVPWPMGVYIFPSPIAECEWVHEKLVDGSTMDESVENETTVMASWYKYDSSFHKPVCDVGDPRFHPDSLPGIAVYGGVCGRMATLEARKSGCMGMPATTKGEPGHCAGWKFKGRDASWTTLNVVTGVPELSYLSLRPVVKSYSTLEVAVGSDAFPNVTTQCLDCSSSWSECQLKEAGSDACSLFEVDTESRLMRRKGGNQCLDQFWGPKPGVWGCSGGANANQNFEVNEAGDMVIASNRGTTRYRATTVPPEPVDDRCLSCSKHSDKCTLEAMNSSACTKFFFDEEAKLIKPTTGQCVDMHSGPAAGLWGCASTSVNQQAQVTEEGLLSITSSRGNLRFLRWPIVSDVPEEGRCLSCKAKNSACDYAAAGSEDCTLFGYDAETTLIYNNDNGQCFHMRSGPLPGSHHCQSSWSSQKAALDDSTNMLKLWDNGRGMLLLRKAGGGGPLPSPSTKWAFQGFHEIKCTKSNCHYRDMLGLDSSQLFWTRHKEAALANVEAFNDYQTSGLWPTAHDEARLAASMAHSLRKAGVEDAATEPLVAWALRRNGALYEAWELAAEYPDGGALDAASQPDRSDLASHQWYDALSVSLLRLRSSTSAGRAAADRFAKEHLLAAERWVAYPQLHQKLINTLCGALSNDTLGSLGEAGEQCALLMRLAEGLGWEDTQGDMAELEIGEGNSLSDAFQYHWEVVARLAVDGQQHESAAALVEQLLRQLTVGYINERSETFWAAHHRVLLRGPYAHMLQLAGVLLPQARREELLNSTRAVLEDPLANSDQMLSYPEALKDSFLEWLTSHSNSTSHGVSGDASADVVDGYDPDDGANPEVMRQMKLDQDEEMELGARLWDEEFFYVSAEGFDDRFDIHAVLATLLNLHTLDASSPGQVAAATASATPGPTLAGTQLTSVRTRRDDCSSAEWPEHPGKYSGGYAGGVSAGFSLEGAKAKCLELGSACAAVTCSSGGVCTVRASSTFGSSPSGEVTYEKVCNQEPIPTPAPTPTKEPMSATQSELLQYCVADLLSRQPAL